MAIRSEHGRWVLHLKVRQWGGGLKEDGVPQSYSVLMFTLRRRVKLLCVYHHLRVLKSSITAETPERMKALGFTTGKLYVGNQDFNSCINKER